MLSLLMHPLVAFRQYKVARRHGSGAGRLEHRHKILTLEAAAKV